MKDDSDRSFFLKTLRKDASKRIPKIFWTQATWTSAESQEIQ